MHKIVQGQIVKCNWISPWKRAIGNRFPLGNDQLSCTGAS